MVSKENWDCKQDPVSLEFKRTHRPSLYGTLVGLVYHH